MFFEKWFDKGDLVMYSSKEGFACYDELGNMSTVNYESDSQISVFLRYPTDNYDVCEIYIVSKQKTSYVSQHDITLLSKNTEL